MGEGLSLAMGEVSDRAVSIFDYRLPIFDLEIGNQKSQIGNTLASVRRPSAIKE
jgi:hypothetical protein